MLVKSSGQDEMAALIEADPELDSARPITALRTGSASASTARKSIGTMFRNGRQELARLRPARLTKLLRAADEF